MNKEDLKALLGYKGVAGLGTKIVLAHEGGPTLLMTRPDEDSPWMMGPSAFDGLFDDVLQPFVGKVEEAVNIKKEIEAKVLEIILKNAGDEVKKKISDILEFALKVEKSLVSKVPMELIDKLQGYSIKEIRPLLDSNLIDFFNEEKEKLEKIKVLFENDYRVGVEKYLTLVKWFEGTKEKIEASANLNENNKKVLADFTNNLEVIKSKMVMPQTRQIPESWNKIEFAKTMFENKFSDVDEIISALA